MFQEKHTQPGTPSSEFQDQAACTLSFSKLIAHYAQAQANVQALVAKVASKVSYATPGRFLLVQFAMAQVTQLGDTISNLISQVNSMISNSIRNQKTS